MFHPLRRSSRSGSSAQGFSRGLGMIAIVLGLGFGAAPFANAKRAPERSAYESAIDMAQGSTRAKAVLIEYASITCPHCRAFYRDLYPELAKKYIKTGKLRFVFREFPTPPTEIAIAGFIIARCSGPQNYFAVIGSMFDAQDAVFASLQEQKSVREIYFGIGERDGKLTKTQITDCLKDPAQLKTVEDIVTQGQDKNQVRGTPTLILNGKTLEGAKYGTKEGLFRAIDLAIAQKEF